MSALGEHFLLSIGWYWRLETAYCAAIRMVANGASGECHLFGD